MDQLLQTKKIIQFHQHPRKDEYVNKHQFGGFCFGVLQKVLGSNLMVCRGLWCLESACFTSARFYSPYFLGIFLNSTFAGGCLSGRHVVVCLSGFAQYLKAMCLLLH